MQNSRARIRLARSLALSTALAGGVLGLVAPAAAQSTSSGTINSIVANGSGTTNVNTATPNTTTITVGNSRTILNWNSFNVTSGQTVNFVVTNNSDAVLNRVVGGASTTINGNLNSYVGAVGGTTGGQIFVLNSAGVIFGSSARVNVGGLVAGTRDLTDADFLDGNTTYDFSGLGSPSATVLSGANLSASNGSIILIADSVTSNGVLNANGEVAIVAARDIRMELAPGSPLSLFIARGASVSGNVTAAGTIQGRNVYLASVNANSFTNSTLNVAAAVTATGASATDRGIVLTAGTSASGINLDSSAETAGGARMFISGSLSSAKNVEFRSSTFVDARDASAINADGSVTGSANSSIVFNSITSGNDISLSASVIGEQTLDLLLEAGGSITLDGFVNGRDVALIAGPTIQAGNISAADDIFISATGDVQTGILRSGVVSASDVAGVADARFGGTLSGNDIRVSGRTLNIGSAFAAGTGSDVNLSADGSLILGGATSGGTMDLASALTIDINGLLNSGTNSLRAIAGNGNLTIASGARLTGGEVILSTGGAFINQRGSDAIAAANRWLVYSAAPGNNTFGELNSGDTAVWNGTLATAAPGTLTGNRYIFAFQPTITVRSTNTSKVYGTDLTGALNGFVNVSGLQSGVTGAYLGDTLADVLSGNALITSAGSGARASVASGPYVMVVNQGTLTTSRGYALALDSAGLLTVTRKAITASVAVNNMTYDGTRTGSGTVTLNGVVSGDTVGTTGTTFTFADKNAGTGKPVAIAGTTLSGADAANYTLTVPASAVGDILAKAITASVTVNNKTYDGTRTGAGTVTLSGVVTGDTVGTTGTTFTFADKNAGTGKTVAIAGTTLNGTDAGNYTLTVPSSAFADILAKAITASVTVNNKTYDGTRAGTGSVTLNGVVSGDTVGTTGTTFTFADKNAGTGKTVAITGATLNGADAGNYTLTVPATALADILAKAITASITVNNKTYDGTRTGTGTVTLNGVVTGDTVGTTGTTFTFADKNAGTGKTVAIAGTQLSGADAGNYTLTVPATALGDILAKAITASVAVNNKTYDGTRTGAGTVTLTGVVSGDTVGTTGTTFTFADKNAGAGKTVAIAGTTLNGADAGNYTLTVPATALADILAKAITASVTVNNKTYDSTRTGAGTVTLNGVVNGDTVGTTGTTFTFTDKNAGTGKTVTIAGTTLNGADAGNYTLTVPATALADILAKAITGSVTVNNKTYDGTRTGTGTVTLIGVVSGDTVGTTSTTFTFADKNAGTGKTVAIAGTTLNGTDAGNYTLTIPASALADILAKAITASVTVNNKTYDGTRTGTGTVTLSGVVSGDTVGTTGTTFTFADKNAGTSKTVAIAGTTLNGADAGNYTVTVPASALADILARQLVITADNKEKTQGSPDPALTFKVGGDGLASGDTISGALSREVGELLGQYAISRGTIDAGSNYTLRFEGGTLTIIAPPFRQVPLRSQVLPSDLASPAEPGELSIDASALCDGDDASACQLAH